ncbi:hypothetical protein F0562_005951 [Nyssa sinensis]|uniref:Retrotransposon gag domain-containing protein n=1 Tax=Nyssa sinensis TaxID=561372 RepID=A0A5J5AN91_9ASTE|nr:hypothetical protein F0562_005951 [Nyssa sinensis]
MVENTRIFKFLAGLNDEFDEVRGRILGRQPLPPLGEVFSEIRQEDCRRSVMMKKKEDEIVEKSALVAANNPAHHSTGNTDLATANISAQRPYSNQRKLEDKPRVWCDYCNKPHHTRENCWKLHGKPTNWKSNKSGSSSSNHAVPKANEANFLSAEQANIGPNQ